MNRTNQLLSAAWLVSVVAIYAFMFFPIVIEVATAFGKSALIEFPPAGFTLRWFGALASPDWYRPFMISLILAVGSTLISAIVGIPAAWALSRFEFPGRGAIKQLFLAPLFVPGSLPVWRCSSHSTARN
jgi:putative spermidine/putrescine transport system permease protein